MNTSVELCGVTLKNPVMTASGTFGSGAEYSEFTDLNRLGAVVTKGVANVPWPGNPTPRVAEVYGGMLNAVGLQNPGIDLFCERDIPFLKKYDTKIIVNVCGHSTEEYVEVVKRLAEEPVDMLEINISCPNVKEGGIAFGQDPKAVEAITKEMKKYAKQPVIMKLSPNVTDITEMARAAEAGGADALSLINTITGMKIDINRRKFVLANKTGGMSGPAIHPVAVRMVYQTAQAVKVPIIGMGGIMNAAASVNNIRAGLSEAIQERIRNERMKADLITNVSHDIKTPLTSIVNYVDLLKRENLENENARNYIRVLDEKSQRLKQLTEDLVEASKISSGNIQLDMQTIDLVELLYQTGGEFNERFEARGLTIVTKLPHNSVMIRADGRQLYRAIENLYTNAAKYALENTRVYVDLEVEENNAVFRIKNISKNPLPEQGAARKDLTERFVRGEESRTTEGSGLGLSIAKNLTQLMGGEFAILVDGDLFAASITFAVVA